MLEQIVAVLDGIAIVIGIVLGLSVPVWLVSGTVGAVLDAVHRRRHREDPEVELWAETVDRGLRGGGES
jgi:hypothetical protein